LFLRVFALFAARNPAGECLKPFHRMEAKRGGHRTEAEEDGFFSYRGRVPLAGAVRPTQNQTRTRPELIPNSSRTYNGDKKGVLRPLRRQNNWPGISVTPP
jgi:hypothetical protein